MLFFHIKKSFSFGLILHNHRKNLTKNFFFTIIYLFYIIVFIFSGFSKITAFSEFTIGLQEIFFIPSSFITILALSIVILELVIAFLLLFSDKKITIRFSILLLVVFTILLIYSATFYPGWNCNCFGAFTSLISFYTTPVVRNIILITIGLILYFNEKYIKISNWKSRILFLIGILLVYILISIDIEDIGKGPKKNIFEGSIFTNVEINKILENQLPEHTKEEFLLLIVFSLDDCSYCLLDAFNWSKINNMYDNNLNVIGLFNGNPGRSFNIFKKHKKINFKILENKDNWFLKNYEVIQPAKILIKNDTVIDITRSSGNIKNQEKYYRKLDSLIIYQGHIK